MVTDTISVLIPIFIRSDNSITYYINILIIIITRRKLFASSVISISFIVEGAGEFTSLLICTLSGPLSLCSQAIVDYYYHQVYEHQIYLPLGTPVVSQDNTYRPLGAIDILAVYKLDPCLLYLL